MHHFRRVVYLGTLSPGAVPMAALFDTGRRTLVRLPARLVLRVYSS